jgi:hypothetical protein
MCIPRLAHAIDHRILEIDVCRRDWLPQAIAVAIIVAFLIGIIALERERRG